MLPVRSLAFLLLAASLCTAEEAIPKTPQESAERYFAAMASDTTPQPAPMMIAKYKSSPEEVAAHARRIAKQLEKKPLQSSVLVTGEKLARVISTNTVLKADKSVTIVYIDLEKEGDAWLISDVNMSQPSQLRHIVNGFKNMKDPQAVESKAKAAATTRPATRPSAK